MLLLLLLLPLFMLLPPPPPAKGRTQGKRPPPAANEDDEKLRAEVAAVAAPLTVHVVSLAPRCSYWPSRLMFSACRARLLLGSLLRPYRALPVTPRLRRPTHRLLYPRVKHAITLSMGPTHTPVYVQVFGKSRRSSQRNVLTHFLGVKCRRAFWVIPGRILHEVYQIVFSRAGRNLKGSQKFFWSENLVHALSTAHSPWRCGGTKGGNRRNQGEAPPEAST